MRRAWYAVKRAGRAGVLQVLMVLLASEEH